MEVCFENPIFQGAKEDEIMGYLAEVTDRMRRRILQRYLATEARLEDGWYDDQLSSAENLDRLAAHLRSRPAEMLDRLSLHLALPSQEWQAAGDAEARVAMLIATIRARVDAQTGFDEKSLHRMLSRRGNPTARTLAKIVAAIREDMGIVPHVRVATV